jgi:HD-like signal output (HDOD) protein
MLKPPRKQKATLESVVFQASRSELASIGSVMNKMFELIRSPHSGARHLQELIEKDPPLAAKVLRRSNSAYYGLKRSITSIREAIVFIGFNNVRELAMSLKVGRMFEKDTVIGVYSRKELWKHSLATAMCCKAIYRKEFRETGEDIYSAALLHDIGIIAEEQFATEELESVTQKMDSDKISFFDAEKRSISFDHCAIGEKLTLSWNMPAEIVYPIKHSHTPLGYKPEYERQTKTIFVADVFCSKSGYGFEQAGFPEEEYNICLETLSLAPESVEIIFEEVSREMAALEKNGELFV